MENLVVWFVYYGSENVQMIMVWYVDDDVFDIYCVIVFDYLFQCWNYGFGIVGVKMFGIWIVFVQELFEIFGFDQFGQDCFFVFGGKGNVFVWIFEVFLQLGFFLWIGDMYEFYVYWIVIGVFENIQYLVWCCCFQFQIVVDEDFLVQGCIGKVIGGWVQFGLWVEICQVEWVYVCSQVVVYVVGVDYYDGVD